MGLLGLAGCRGCGSGEPEVVDAGPAPLVVLPPSGPTPANAVEALAARAPARTGRCAQVRSLKEQAEAEAVADAIRKALNTPVELLKADLGERGTWWRICVGDEESEARLVARATRWTQPGGELEPFLDAGDASDGRPRFFVQSREKAEARRATDAQAKTLVATALVDGAPVLFAGGPAQDAVVVASTAKTDAGGTDVVVVDTRGVRLGFDDKPAPGCASCQVALKDGAVRARRAVAAGDAAPQAGTELLVEEDTTAGVRLLSVLAVEAGALHRVASLVLENARPGFVMTGSAGLVEADLDAQREIVLATTELSVQGDRGCGLERHVALFDLPQGAAGLVRIDPLKLPETPEDAVINVVTALDDWGDHDAASRACAGQLAREPHAATTQLCIERVRRLVEQGALVEAVNAAGLMAEASPSLRPLLATSFHDAAEALDKDARLFAGEIDCGRSPLVDQLGTRPLAESLKIASARAQERVALADVADAAFVTGARDFGPESPVGQITARWLDRARVALPARYAAIEALLLPQAPPQEAAATPDGGASFGGAP
jgi:hypothetical protein